MAVLGTQFARTNTQTFGTTENSHIFRVKADVATDSRPIHPRSFSCYASTRTLTAHSSSNHLELQETWPTAVRADPHVTSSPDH